MKRSLCFAVIWAAGHLNAGTMASAAPPENCASAAPQKIEIDATGATAAVIDVGAADLKIRGKRGSMVRVSAKGCASSLHVDRSGDAIRIESALSQGHLRIEVPAGLPIALQDASGATDISGIAGGKIVDGSGDLTIRDVNGSLMVTNGSGDLHIAKVVGKLTLDNASGDILIGDVKGDILITRDGTGDITILRSGGNLTILEDSAGELTVDNVAGNFDLKFKASGKINLSRIHGTTHIPEQPH